MLDDLPAGALLSVNLSGPLLLDPRTSELLLGTPHLDRLILEVTENSLLEETPGLVAEISRLIGEGIKFAVDDMGAGYSGLRQITSVRPSYLKLDRSLVSGIDTDPDRGALVSAMLGYVRQTGGHLVAEGVETDDELETLVALGVTLIQGYLLGRPGRPGRPWPPVAAREPDGDATHSLALRPPSPAPLRQLLCTAQAPEPRRALEARRGPRGERNSSMADRPLGRRTRSRLRAGVLACALIAAGGIAGLPAAAAAAPAAAAPAAAACQPYSGRPCLFPFPDNRLTRVDHTSATGVRVNLPQAAMPRNTKGVQITTGSYDRDDGFSPGSDIVLHIPGLDNARALARTGAVGLADMAKGLAKRQPIVVIDQATGRRQLIWAELDANATGAANTDLLIHPGVDFTEGHTYIVALRDLRTSSGRAITAPKWFARLRAGGRLPAAGRAQSQRYAAIFAALKRSGISRDKSLYEAWGFTVESRQSLTGRMLAIRNNAFSQLGDSNLADSTDAGHAPAFSVTDTTPLVSGAGATLTQVDGTLQVPCYLITCGPATQPGFHYGSSKPDATPTQTPGNVATTQFECVVPSNATALTPARISLYGHGLLGSRDEVTAGNVEAMAAEHDMVFCATDFWGLASQDTLNDAAALGNLNLFPAVIDRLQQGALNTLYLGRLMLNPTGLASNPAFQQAGQPVIETSNLYYDGNSQGGIEGGMLTALAPDFRHAVLGVTGIDYANLLVQRSTDFAPFGKILYATYTDQSSHPLVLDLMQQLWDRGEPDGYAEQMTSHPLPGTPSHQVLMQIAYGDHQVSMYSAAVEARTVGASAYQPAVDLSTNRSRDRQLFYGLPTIKSFPFSGSAIEVWDSGAGRVQPPPLANLAPVDSTTNIDPHEDVRSSPEARVQKSAFLQPNGTIVNVCGGAPCRTSVYQP